MGELVLGVAFLGVGAAIAALFGRVATLTCRRGATGGGACVLTDRGLGAARVTAFPLAGLRKATVSTDWRNGRADHRVMLHTGPHPLPFSQGASNRGAAQHRIAERINAFLADPREETLTVEQDDRPFAYGLGAAFAVAGLALLAAALLGL